MIKENIVHFLLCIWYILYWCFAFWFFFPCWVWRHLMVLYVHYFEPDLSELLTGHDVMFVLENYYETTYATNMKIIILEENVNIDMIRNGFVANVLSAVNEANQPVFERLYQIPHSIGGVYFWKKISIDVLNQIRENNNAFSKDPVNHEAELNMLLGELMTKPFQKDCPIWEIILCRGYKTTQSVLVFRLHHSLGDGYSFNYIIDRMIQKSSKYTVRQRRKSCLDKAHCVWTLPRKLFALGGSTFIHRDYYTHKKVNAHGVVSMTTINLETMKKIRRVTKTHFATVGMSLLAGALKRCLHERILPGQKCPDYVSIMHSLPKPKHPIKKMVNHWGVGFFKIPMTTISALERLTQSEKAFGVYISEQFDEIIKGHVIPCMGVIPAPILRFLFFRNVGTAIGFTNIPAYESEGYLFGHFKILDIFKIFGLQFRHSAVAGAIYSHNGKVSFAINANKDIIPDQATVDRVVKQYLHDELDELLRQCRLPTADSENNNSITSSPEVAKTFVEIE